MNECKTCVDKAIEMHLQSLYSKQSVKDAVKGTIVFGVVDIFLGQLSVLTATIATVVSVYYYVVKGRKNYFWIFGAAVSWLTFLVSMFSSYYNEFLSVYSMKIPVIDKMLENAFRNINSKRMVFPIYNTDPQKPTTGQVWFNSTEGQFKGYDGEDVVILG